MWPTPLVEDDNRITLPQVRANSVQMTEPGAFCLQLDRFDLDLEPAAVVGQERSHNAEDSVTEAADIKGEELPQPSWHKPVPYHCEQRHACRRRRDATSRHLPFVLIGRSSAQAASLG